METRKLGRYEIASEIGKGAMGTVYKAIDPLLERTVAIKIINIAADDPEMAEYEARFYQEAKAVGGLNHRNIVTVYDVAKSGDMPYLAMELLDGHELGTVIANGRLPVAHALDIAAQVADGLAYAHEHGVVHRDIKPANIMVLHDGVVKIADFGIARMRSAERGSESSPVLGSPRYMSPEQVLRKRAESRSDIFSLGVVLYEMLTGAPPFSGADLNAILFQIVNLVPPAPSTMNPEMPEMVDFVVAKALAKTPDERYESARELANDLRECRRKIDAPAPLATLAIFKPSVPRLDPYAATPLLTQSYPDARHGDAHPEAPDGATTLGLSKEFDSFSATARLAVHTGVAETFGELVKTQETELDGVTVYGTLVRDQSASRVMPGFGSTRWDAQERMIFMASVAAAVLLAALILVL
ncbi:MAG TPA: serine/threonine-protein kinase [Burkholderiales bacterium]|nr:serine/threonine-protein kinase [Burkholderiales bacterium]